MNIIKPIIKTALYMFTPKDKQTRAMEFLQKELFTTPEWLIDEDIFNKIQFDGYLEKIKSYQERTLNNLLDFGKFARMMEKEEINEAAYAIVDMMEDLHKGLVSELNHGE